MKNLLLSASILFIAAGAYAAGSCCPSTLATAAEVKKAETTVVAKAEKAEADVQMAEPTEEGKKCPAEKAACGDKKECSAEKKAACAADKAACADKKECSAEKAAAAKSCCPAEKAAAEKTAEVKKCSDEKCAVPAVAAS